MDGFLSPWRFPVEKVYTLEYNYVEQILDVYNMMWYDMCVTCIWFLELLLSTFLLLVSLMSVI